MTRITTIQELSLLLGNTLLAQAKVISLDIPQSDAQAFAIQIHPENGIEAWELMRSLIVQTKCYPVIVDSQEYPSTSEDWEQSMRGSNFFSRWYYEEEVNGREDQAVDIQSIIARSQLFDIDQFIEEDEDYFWDQFEDEERSEMLMGFIDKIRERYGSAPTLDQLKLIVTGDGDHESIKLEKWLFEWEISHFDHDKVAAFTGKKFQHDWFNKYQKHIALMLLPTENGWETLAYLHWYGSLFLTSGGAIAFLKKWYEQHQAELVCHYGTVIELKVPKLPRTIQEAFNFAVEHSIFSGYTVSNSGSIREYARELMHYYHWYFHERP
jgi:Domain of unknown function (DUF4253)